MAGLTGVTSGSDLLSVVSRAAPMLGSVLGSPLAGVAVSLISQAFGANPSDIESLAATVNADPEAAYKLRKLELEHVDTLEQIRAQNYTTEVSDRLDARRNAGLYKDFMRHLAYLVTVGFFGVFVVLFMPLAFDDGQRELLSMLVGMLVSKWQTIIDFFYGSSHPNHGRRIEK
jgi:hypothetical protein